jgi:glutaredoxin
MVDDGHAAVGRSGSAAATPTRIRVVLILVLLAVFAGLQLKAALAPQDATAVAWEQDGRLHVFFQPDCPHCHRAIEFLKSQPDIAFELHDVSTVAGERLLGTVVEQLAISETNFGVPLFVYGRRHLIGFDSAETTGRELRKLITKPETATPRAVPPSIRLPIFGDIDPSHYSLFVLTAVMALADGFNPCAMWVLIYLISLIAGLQDREKIWWLVGTFVLASGILFPVHDGVAEHLPGYGLCPSTHTVHCARGHRLRHRPYLRIDLEPRRGHV